MPSADKRRKKKKSRGADLGKSFSGDVLCIVETLERTHEVNISNSSYSSALFQ